MKRIDDILNFIQAKRYYFVGFLLILTVSFAYLNTKLLVDNSLSSWFNKNSPAVQNYYSFIDEYGNDDIITSVLIDTLPFYNPDRLAKLTEIEENLKSIKGINAVLGITNTQIRFSDPQSTLKNYIDSSGYSTDEIVEKIRNSKLNSQFLGHDNYTVIFYSEVDTALMDQRSRIIEDVRKVCSGQLKTAHGGYGVVFEILNETTVQEGLKFTLLSALVLVVFMILLTRSIAITLNTLFSITVSVIILLGIINLSVGKINMLSVAYPILIMVSGLAVIIHMYIYVRGIKGNRKGEILRIILIPIIINILTSAGGFIALSISDMEIIKQYGIFAGIGIILVFIINVITTLFIIHRIKWKENPNKIWASFLSHIMCFSFKNPLIILSASVIIIIISIIGIYRIDVDNSSFDMLPRDHHMHEDHQLIIDKVGDYFQLEFIIELKDRKWNSAKIVRSIDKLQQELAKDSMIYETITVVDLIKDIHQQNYGNKSYLSSPMRFVTLTDGLSKQQQIHRFIGNDGTHIRLTALVPGLTAKGFNKVGDFVVKSGQEILGDDAEIRRTGYLPLYSSIVDSILKGSFKTFLLAFILIIILLFVFLRSWTFSFIIIPANLIPVLVTMSLMGFLNIRLDIGTLTVAAAIFGIIVDDSVHLIYSFKHQLQKSNDFREVVHQVSNNTGMAISTTSLILVSGFAILALSKIKLISDIGILMLSAIAIALILDVFLIPAMISFTHRKMKKGNVEN